MGQLESRLEAAIDLCDYDLVKMLLENGANPNAVDVGGNTCLHRAIDAEIDWDDPNPPSAEPTMVSLLLAHGANPNVTVNGKTPLDFARGDADLRNEPPKLVIHYNAWNALKKAGAIYGSQMPESEK